MNIDYALSSNVLKLNKNYSPVGIISVKEAFTKLFSEAAEVITIEDGTYATYDFSSWAEMSDLQCEFNEYGEHDEWINTSSLTIKVPRIIRLTHFDKVPRHGIKLNRRNIYGRDDNRCQYCGKPFSTQELTIDHVVPKCQGGTNKWTNLVCCCVKCNRKKGGRTPEQSRMHLVKKPVKPLFSPTITVKIGKHPKYRDWTHFISERYWLTELQE